MFRLEPAAAWRALPVGLGSDAQEVTSPVTRPHAAIVDIARNSIAAEILVDVKGRGRSGLAELAVEAESLLWMVTEDETATILGMPATLPTAVRNTDGRWRGLMTRAERRTGRRNAALVLGAPRRSRVKILQISSARIWTDCGQSDATGRQPSPHLVLVGTQYVWIWIRGSRN